MKTLVYTCNDLRHSLPCVDLLYSSLLENNSSDSFDFVVLCNSKDHLRTDYKVLYDESYPPQYLGFLKYSSSIPTNYDFYVYLDSDILFYSRLNEILPSTEKTLCVASEGNAFMIDSDWHSHGYNDKLLLLGQPKPCINAGQFSFRGSCNLTSLVRNNMETTLKSITSYQNLPSHYCAMYEQSSFNYTLISMWDNIDLNKIGSRLSVRPEQELQSGKSIFHFTGFHDGMITKNNRMKNFIQQHQKGRTINAIF